MKNSASSKDNNYKDFIESGTVEYICQKSDNYKYHYRKYKSTAALHRENGQSYIYVDNDSLALFETLINGTNNGINMDKQIMKGRYLMGGNIPFSYKNNKFIFDVAKRQIFIVNDEQQPIGAGVELKSTDDLVALLDGLLQADTLTDDALN